MKNEKDAAQSLLLLSVAAEGGSSDTPALECSMSPDGSQSVSMASCFLLSLKLMVCMMRQQS